jgi:putative endopeptidase
MRIAVRVVLLFLVCLTRIGFAQAVHGIDRAYMDTTCAPCQDFYSYANGDWIVRARLPDSHSEVGTLDDLAMKRATTLARILDSLRSTPTIKGPEAKVAKFYSDCMDVSTIEAQGTAPMQPELKRIREIKSLADLEAEVARLHRMQIAPFFVLQALPDAKDSKHIIADISPAGLGLGDKGAYLATDSESVAGRGRYEREIALTLQVAGESTANARMLAQKVMALETRLAAATLGMEMSRDPEAVYHKVSVSALGNPSRGGILSGSSLGNSSPGGWSWAKYFRDMGQPGVTAVNVQEPHYLEIFNAALTDVPLPELKAYLTLRYARAATRRLGGATIDSLLGEFGRGNLAKQSTADRSHYCVDETESHVGWIVGRIYAATAFTSSTRAKAAAMVRNIRGVLRDELKSVAWLSTDSRAEALRKLDSFVVEIGYPNKWPDYSGVEVRSASFWNNVVAANEYQTKLDIARIGHAQKLDDWWPGYWPQTADAYFNENLNEIVMAAGYMQPPFFDPAAEDAFNYGAFGAVIGHEMTHAFDDRGRKFDSGANLREWWSAADKAAFEERSSRAIAQYDQYIAIDTLHLNGRQTLSENLADIGGLKLAYAALERSLSRKPRVAVNGYTPEQRFFIAYAQSRRALDGPDYLRDKVMMNVHSPERWRVVGPIVNMPEFAAAFRCVAGDAMTLRDAERVRLW